MWELDYKEGRVLKNWCFLTVVLEKTLESALDCKEIKPVNPKGNQPWIFIGRIDAEAEAPVLWPPDMQSRLTEKKLKAGKDWGQEKGATKIETSTHWNEFEQTPGDSEGQETWHAVVHGVTKSDRTEWLNNNKPQAYIFAWPLSIVKLLSLPGCSAGNVSQNPGNRKGWGLLRAEVVLKQKLKGWSHFWGCCWSGSLTAAIPTPGQVAGNHRGAGEGAL